MLSSVNTPRITLVVLDKSNTLLEAHVCFTCFVYQPNILLMMSSRERIFLSKVLFILVLAFVLILFYLRLGLYLLRYFIHGNVFLEDHIERNKKLFEIFKRTRYMHYPFIPGAYQFGSKCYPSSITG